MKKKKERKGKKWLFSFFEIFIHVGIQQGKEKKKIDGVCLFFYQGTKSLGIWGRRKEDRQDRFNKNKKIP